MGPHFRSGLARFSPLLTLLVLALIPYGWFAEQYPAVGAVLYSIFASEAAHAIGHTLIFLLVGAVLLLSFPGLVLLPRRYFGLILLTAMAQEGFQLLYKGRGVTRNDLTDIGIDLTAAALVFALFWLRSRSPAQGPQRADGVL